MRTKLARYDPALVKELRETIIKHPIGIYEGMVERGLASDADMIALALVTACDLYAGKLDEMIVKMHESKKERQARMEREVKDGTNPRDTLTGNLLEIVGVAAQFPRHNPDRLRGTKRDHSLSPTRSVRAKQSIGG